LTGSSFGSFFPIIRGIPKELILKDKTEKNLLVYYEAIPILFLRRKLYGGYYYLLSLKFKEGKYFYLKNTTDLDIKKQLDNKKIQKIIKNLLLEFNIQNAPTETKTNFFFNLFKKILNQKTIEINKNEIIQNLGYNEIKKNINEYKKKLESNFNINLKSDIYFNCDLSKNKFLKLKYLIDDACQEIKMDNGIVIPGLRILKSFNRINEFKKEKIEPIVKKLFTKIILDEKNFCYRIIDLDITLKYLINLYNLNFGNGKINVQIAGDGFKKTSNSKFSNYFNVLYLKIIHPKKNIIFPICLFEGFNFKIFINYFLFFFNY